MKNRSLIFLSLSSLAAVSVAACGADSTGQNGADSTGQNGDAEAGDGYPSEPISIVVKSSAGSGTDTMARQAAKFLQDELGVAVAVENRTGGDGAVAIDDVLSAPADGTVLGADTRSMVIGINGHLSDRYDVEDFAFLSQVQAGPYVLVVNADSDIETLDDFAAAVEENEGFTVGGYGAQSGDHLFINGVTDQLGIEPRYIPFEGGSEVMTAVLGGNVDAAITTSNNAVSYIQEGQMRGVAVATEEPLKLFPEAAPFVEQGLDDSTVMSNYRYFYAKAGTPDEVVNRLEEALLALTEDEDWQEYVESNALENDYLNSAELTDFVKKDSERIKETLESL